MRINEFVITVGLLLIPAQDSPANALQEIKDNFVVKETMRFKPGKYLIRDEDRNGVLQIGADNITVDLQGVELWGGKEDEVDQYFGIGVSLGGHKNVTIRNASVHGYQFNIRVTNASSIQILDSDVSFPRGPVINDNGEIKNIWLSLRDVNAWRRYGAGIWIENSKACRVEKCRGNGAANGLLCVNTVDSKIYHNDFSFNSSWGIGLFESSRNEVFWNQIDFVGRPWAGSVGADAAALVVVHGSNKNWFIGNSFTHSGDGFFLTHPKPSEDNIVAFNDGSYSPHNAFEGTFSKRNYFVKNLANHSHYGFWLGYSSNNVVLENEINDNGNGVAIEHAVGSIIVGNEMLDTRGPAVNLWGGRKGYPSENSVITWNTIRNARPALRLMNSDKVTFKNNKVQNASVPTGMNLESSNIKFSGVEFWNGAVGKRLNELGKQLDKNISLWSKNPRWPTGLFWYKFDRWAPHDFRKDDCFFAQSTDGKLHVWIMQDGWKLSSQQEGFSLKPTENLRHFIVQTAMAEHTVGGLWDRVLEMKTKEGQIVSVPFQLRSISWKVEYFRVPRHVKMRDAAGWNKLFSEKPELSTVQGKLSDRWLNTERWGGRWAFTATTTYKFKPGTYKFVTASDDGVRVFVDDKKIIDDWTHHATRYDTATIDLKGAHTIKVCYCQDGGGSAFSIKWHPIKK